MNIFLWYIPISSATMVKNRGDVGKAFPSPGVALVSSGLARPRPAQEFVGVPFAWDEAVSDNHYPESGGIPRESVCALFASYWG